MVAGSNPAIPTSLTGSSYVRCFYIPDTGCYYLLQMKLSARKIDNYHDYAKFYDELKGDRSDKVRLLLDIIAKYRPESRAVIEFACGTGTILEGLAGIYYITGRYLQSDAASSAGKGRRQKRTTITTDAYPDIQIRPGLQDHFKIFESYTVNHDNAERHDDIGRTYYICQKL